MMGRGVPDLIWCGASAPVVQGFLVGLGLLAAGLAVYPFRTALQRPPSGPMAPFVRAKAAVRLGRWTSWILAVLTAGTIAGYVGIYVAAHGKFCDAPLTRHTRTAVVIWVCVAGATALTLITSTLLRGAARRAESD